MSIYLSTNCLALNSEYNCWIPALNKLEIYEDSDSYIYLDLDKNIEACLEVPSVIYKDVINYLESIIGENSLFIIVNIRVIKVNNFTIINILTR